MRFLGTEIKFEKIEPQYSWNIAKFGINHQSINQYIIAWHNSNYTHGVNHQKKSFEITEE